MGRYFQQLLHYSRCDKRQFPIGSPQLLFMVYYKLQRKQQKQKTNKKDIDDEGAWEKFLSTVMKVIIGDALSWDKIVNEAVIELYIMLVFFFSRFMFTLGLPVLFVLVKFNKLSINYLKYS